MFICNSKDFTIKLLNDKRMYEQRNKDINKASAETVLSLAKVLGCTMEDLLEK